jgi:hypothetical protein
MKAIVRMTACAAAAAILLGVQVWAADGIVLVQKFTYADKPPQTHQIQMDQKHMRTESAGPDGSKAVVIFDSARQVMTMVNDANKSYSEISKADMEAAAAQMSAAAAQMTAATAQMQEMMKNLPPERRAQMEAAMKGRMGGAGATPAAPAARPAFKKVGTGTVGKWTCDKYEGYTNGQKTHEMCTVDPKVLGFSPADFQVTRDMVAFFKQFQGQLPQLQQSSSQTFTMGTVEDQGFSGIPVRSVSTTANGSQVTFEIADVHREAFTDATFQPPAGYTKLDLFGGRGRRGR